MKLLIGGVLGGLLLLVVLFVWIGHDASKIIREQDKKSLTEGLAAPAELEAIKAEQRAGEAEKKANQELADKVISDIIYIVDTRINPNVIFAYNKSSGSIANVTGHGIPRRLFYGANGKGKK